MAGLVFERECSIKAFLEDPNIEVELRKDLEGLTKNELRVLRGLARGEKLGEIGVPNKYRAVKALRNRGLVEKVRAHEPVLLHI